MEINKSIQSQQLVRLWFCEIYRMDEDVDDSGPGVNAYGD